MKDLLVSDYLEQLRAFMRRPFVRNVVTVATGTAAAQVIAMAFSPVITRLYGPEAFGLQAIFTSVVGLLSTVAALGYPIAIILPRSDNDAVGIARLTVLIAGVICSLTTLVLAMFGAQILSILDAEEISEFIYLIPVTMFVSVLGSVLGHWLIRKKAFGISARYKVITTFFVSATKSGFGLVYPGGITLILINTLGALLGTLLTYFGWRRNLGSGCIDFRCAA